MLMILKSYPGTLNPLLHNNAFYNVFENIMENGAFAPKEQNLILPFPFYFQKYIQNFKFFLNFINDAII